MKPDTYKGEVLGTYEGHVPDTYKGEVLGTYEGHVPDTYKGEVLGVTCRIHIKGGYLVTLSCSVKSRTGQSQDVNRLASEHQLGSCWVS